jgi:hypothetical protein
MGRVKQILGLIAFICLSLEIDYTTLTTWNEVYITIMGVVFNPSKWILIVIAFSGYVSKNPNFLKMFEGEK